MSTRTSARRFMAHERFSLFARNNPGLLFKTDPYEQGRRAASGCQIGRVRQCALAKLANYKEDRSMKRIISASTTHTAGLAS